MNCQEVEFKWGLPSRRAFHEFQQSVGGEGCDSVLQVNHFFDTPALLLNRARHTFRLRVTLGVYLVTLKGPNTASGELSVRGEIEWNVPQALGLAVLEQDAEPLELITVAREALTEREKQLVDQLLSPAAGQRVFHIGQFENRRTLVNAKLQHQGQQLTAAFELDETSFDGSEPEYEIELEVTAEEAEVYGAAVKVLLDDLGITPSERVSKSRRFFDRVRAARA